VTPNTIIPKEDEVNSEEERPIEETGKKSQRDELGLILSGKKRKKKTVEPIVEELKQVEQPKIVKLEEED
jgi:hypothetical protein